MKTLGILNITSDSFSDGGQFLKLEDAIQKIDSLILDGADIIDVGAQSSNINSIQISEIEEWNRLEPIIKYLKSKNIPISIDSYNPTVIEKSILKNVDYINNINAFQNPKSIMVLKKYKNNLPNLISMYSHNLGDIAIQNSNLKTSEVVQNIIDFFKVKKKEFLDLGISEDKIIFDTGMGFFLGEDSALSLEVIKKIHLIQNEFPNLLLSVSRKSFIGNLLGGVPPLKRETGTLIFEIYLYEKNIPYIRTHNVKQLKEAIHLKQILK